VGHELPQIILILLGVLFVGPESIAIKYMLESTHFDISPWCFYVINGAIIA